MSCKDCEEIQDTAFNKNIATSTPIAYVRIQNANIAVVGCERHVKETIKRIRKGELKK